MGKLGQARAGVRAQKGDVSRCPCSFFLLPERKFMMRRVWSERGSRTLSSKLGLSTTMAYGTQAAQYDQQIHIHSLVQLQGYTGIFPLLCIECR